MNLLDYLKPMKTLPNRFSNLAFWRILRIFKDEVVDALTYVNTWGNVIEKEQSAQDSNIATNTNDITEIWKSVNTLATDRDTLKELVYDGSSNFKQTTVTKYKGNFENVVDALYTVESSTAYLELSTVPFYVDTKVIVSIFTNSDHTATTNITIPMLSSVVNVSGKTRIRLSKTPFYAPYGVNEVTGSTITYISHV